MHAQAQAISHRAFPPNGAAFPIDLITGGASLLENILQQKRLFPVFQPIVSLADASIYAHEALIRGPQGSHLHTPDALLRAAAQEELSHPFEYACMEVAIQTWGRIKAQGRVFVNVSADALMELYNKHGREKLTMLVHSFGVLPRMLVLEITEHERVTDMDQLAEVVQQVRTTGVSMALDDFGDGRSSLRLWSQLKPEIVKIDKYFTKDISAHADKLKTIQALQQIASIFGSELVAEGIETAQDMRVLRDLGISYGQGYFLGHPDRQPAKYAQINAQRVLRERQIAVFPELGRTTSYGQLKNLATVSAPTVTARSTNDELAALFLAEPDLHAIALLEGERPVGLINRARFMNEYSKLYYREVWGRKSCAAHANLEPRLIEKSHSIDQLLGILTSTDQRYLADGFIITENGQYVGLGTGDQLVRSVTETRIEAARHANPLTFLPGNIPISLHIERLLKKHVNFVACYADLNNFKTFNDHYGYWRGDEMIRLLAKVCMEHCDSQRDFLGHVGGDDFILLLQSPNWRERCDRLVADFDRHALMMFDETARAAGGIEAEDRQGVVRFFPCTTLSIGAVVIDGSRFTRPEQVANLAALAKHDAKRSGGGVVERVVTKPS
jgi:diguanylate cyclase (GGDEF)-like protein